MHWLFAQEACPASEIDTLSVKGLVTSVTISKSFRPGVDPTIVIPEQTLGQPPYIWNHFPWLGQKLPSYPSSRWLVLATAPQLHLRGVWASPRAAHCRGNRRHERCIVVCNKMQGKDPQGTIEPMGQWESPRGWAKPIGMSGGGGAGWSRAEPRH